MSGSGISQKLMPENGSSASFCSSFQDSEMSSGSEAGSNSRLIDFVYRSTLGLIVIKKKKKTTREASSA